MHKYLILFLTITLATLFYFNFVLAKPEDLKIIFFDVGQGDAILLTDSKNSQILIDGGPDDKVLEKLGQVMPFWDKTVEMIILTHPDKDHLTGLNYVLENYQVKRIVFSQTVKETDNYQSFLDLAKTESGAEIILPEAKVIEVAPQFALEIVNPSEANENNLTDNDLSIVIRLTSPMQSVLLTGDLETKGERYLIRQNVYIKADVLKVGHHGSKSSSSVNWLTAVSPKQAVISVGRDNRYGHPHQEVLERLSNTEILRTDEKGNIEIDL